MFKEFRTLDWAGVSVPLGVQKAHLEEELGITFRAFGAGWRYDWQSDGMLSRVIRPGRQGSVIRIRCAGQADREDL